MKAGERAYRILREDILNWRLTPGTPLAEIEQAERIGVSRTPVREALARLVAEGLVESRGRVDVVAAFSADHLVELFEFREALETQAARLAARRRNSETFEGLRDEFQVAAAKSSVGESERDEFYALVARFDEAIDDSVDNRYLRSALAGLRTHLVRARRLSRDNPERLARAAAEHLLIAESILARDETLAAQATAVHLHSSRANVLATLRQAEPTPAPDASLAPEQSPAPEPSDVTPLPA